MVHAVHAVTAEPAAEKGGDAGLQVLLPAWPAARKPFGLCPAVAPTPCACFAGAPA